MKAEAFARGLAASVLASFVTACGGGSNPGVTCIGCGFSSITDTYTGAFIQGSASGPIDFTATGETVVVTFHAIDAGNPIPPAPVSGSFSTPCAAATVQSGPADGQLTVTSVAHGSCTLVASSNFGSASVAVTVP